jgi:hypothetical protein
VRDSDLYEFGELLPVFEPWEPAALAEAAEATALEAGARATDDGTALATRDLELAREGLELATGLLP